MITIFHEQHHIIDSFTGLARKVPILGMLHLVVLVVTQCNQSFTCSISNSSLERPSQGDNLNHLANMADTISRILLIYDHPHMPEIGVPSQQPRGSDVEWGIAIT
jgi:hypothetical protein